MSYMVNHENFELFIRKLAIGWNRAQLYNTHSVSVSEVQRSKALQYLLEEVVLRVEKQGYCPVATIHPILEEYSMYVTGPVSLDLAQEIDETFSLDLSDLQQAVDFCEFAYKEAQKEVSK